MTSPGKRGYNISNLGALIRFNPTVNVEQAEWDFNKAVSQDYSLDYKDTDESEVKRFFRELP